MSDGVPFRFEVPNWAWASGADEALMDVLCDPDAFIEIGEEPPPFDRDVSVFRGRCTRQVLAELGPIVERIWREG